MAGVAVSRSVFVSGGRLYSSQAHVESRQPRCPCQSSHALYEVASLPMVCLHVTSSKSCTCFSHTSVLSLEFSLQFVEEPPVGALREQPVSLSLNHTDLVEAQRVKP